MSTTNHLRTADGTELFVRSWGEGMPLVFLSGWTLSSLMWSYQMAPLSRAGFRCIAYDRRGHGRSGDAGGGYDFDTLADDVETVLAGLHLERGVCLVTHSMAACEAVRYVSRHGQRRLAGLVLVAPAVLSLARSAQNPGGVDPAVIDAVRAQFSRDLPGWAEANSAPYFTPGTSQKIIDWTIAMMAETSLQAAIECNIAQNATDFRPELARLALPTLVIHGDRDASAPLELTGRPTAQLIPKAQLRVYEGAPHGLYFTHQEQLNRDLASFARSCAAQ